MPTIIKLSEPVEFGKDVITELVIQQPRAADVKHLGDITKLSQSDLQGLVSRLSGRPSQVIDKLCLADVFAAENAVADFLLAGLPTGGAGSP